MTNSPEGFIEQRRIEFGGELTTWPLLKRAHALSMLMELDRRVAVWSARGLIVTVPQIEADGMCVNFHLQVDEQPPLDEWSLIFADVIHALRSSLDALAWEIASLDGNTPSKPNQVYFPIAGNGFDTKIAAMGEGLDPQFVERFQILQAPTFRLPNQEDGVDVLAALHQLDIDDKHRGALRATGVIGAVNLQASVFLDAGTEVRMQQVKGDVPLETGYRVGRMVVSKPARLEKTVPAPAAVALTIRGAVGGKEFALPQSSFTQVVFAAVDRAIHIMTQGGPQEGSYAAATIDAETFPPG